KWRCCIFMLAPRFVAAPADPRIKLRSCGSVWKRADVCTKAKVCRLRGHPGPSPVGAKTVLWVRQQPRRVDREGRAVGLRLADRGLLASRWLPQGVESGPAITLPFQPLAEGIA